MALAGGLLLRMVFLIIRIRPSAKNMNKSPVHVLLFMKPGMMTNTANTHTQHTHTAHTHNTHTHTHTSLKAQLGQTESGMGKCSFP